TRWPRDWSSDVCSSDLAGRSLLLEQPVVDRAPMQGETDGLLVAVGDGLSGRLVSGDGDEGDLPGRRLRGLGGEEGEVDLFDDGQIGRASCRERVWGSGC